RVRRTLRASLDHPQRAAPAPTRGDGDGVRERDDRGGRARRSARGRGSRASLARWLARSSGGGNVTTDYSLGALRFSLTGSGTVPRSIADEFAPLSDPEPSGPPHIRFDFVDALPAMAGATRVAPLIVTDDAY